MRKQRLAFGISLGIAATARHTLDCHGFVRTESFARTRPFTRVGLGGVMDGSIPIMPTKRAGNSVAPTSMVTDETTNHNCQVHVGNLDWTVSQVACQEQMQNILQDIPFTSMDFKEATAKPRDVGKHHGGSAVLTFGTPEVATAALQRLQSHSEAQSWRVRPGIKEKRQSSTPQSPVPLTVERLEHRQARAARYARKRLRVANATHALLKRISIASIPTFKVPLLDWSLAPALVDPAHGGGLDATSMRRQARAVRKRAAVEAFVVLVQSILMEEPSDNDTPLRIADLGCGAGNLALPLAWWLRQKKDSPTGTPCTVLGVDVNEVALQRLQDRTRQVCQTDNATDPVLVETLCLDLLELLKTSPQKPFSQCSAVVSLHACGAASDLAMAAAVQYQLPFVISPCCIGKLNTARSSETTTTSLTGMPPPMVSTVQRSAAPNGMVYPRSKWLRHEQSVTPEEYQLLASAADYGASSSSSDTADSELQRERFERCRKAKHIVEADRLAWAAEQGYTVRLLELPRMGPSYTKLEVLVGAVEKSPEAQRILSLPVVAS